METKTRDIVKTFYGNKNCNCTNVHEVVVPLCTLVEIQVSNVAACGDKETKKTEGKKITDTAILHTRLLLKKTCCKDNF